MQDVDKFKNEMNLSGKNVYVGHRYVPKIFGEWDNTKIYEPLSIVQYQGNSFTSRQYVPVGIEITNEEYWASTGNYNAQIEQYRQEIRAFDNRISDNEVDINANKSDIDTLNTQLTQTHANVMDYGAVGDGVTDDTLAIQAALNTGKRVYFPNPPEEYIVSDNLLIEKNGQYVYGASKVNTKIKQTNTEKDLFVINAYDSTVTNLYMSGNVTTPLNRTAGVKLNSSVRGNIHNNTIRYFGFGVSSEDSKMAWINVIDKNNIEYCSLATIYLPKNAHGFRITLNELRASKYGIVIGGLNSDGTVNEAFNTVAGGSISIRDNTIEGNRDIDIVVLNGNFSTDIEGNYFETAQNQNEKKWVIQVGTNGTARAFGVSINKNYFYTYPQFSEDFPIIKLYRFSFLNVTNNDSLSPNQVLIDNSEATGTGNIVEQNNYVNGNKLISDINASVAMQESKYPLTKNSGYQKVIYQYDSTTSKNMLALGVNNRYADGFNFNAPIHSKNKTVLGGELKLPFIPFNNKSMGLLGGGTVTVNDDKSFVIKTADFIIVNMMIDLTISAGNQILAYTSDYTLDTKKPIVFNDTHVLGELTNNGTDKIKVYSKNTGFAIDTSTSGNYKLTGSFIVPLENK